MYGKSFPLYYYLLYLYMEPQESKARYYEKLFLSIIAGFVIGSAAGFYSGWIIGQTLGMANATLFDLSERYVAPQTTAHTQTNPLEDVKTSPLDGVKLNPFH